METGGVDVDGVEICGPLSMLRNFAPFNFFMERSRVVYGQRPLERSGIDQRLNKIQFGSVAGMKTYLVTELNLSQVCDLFYHFFAEAPPSR